MLKSKIKMIALLMVTVLSLSVSFVNAADENATTSGNEAVPISNENQTNQVVTDDSAQTNQPSEEIKKNDVYLTGDNVTIDYMVDGNVFILANTVTIKSQIGGDAFICAKKINIEKEGYVFSNLFALTDELNIAGVVYDVYSSANKINISGYIYRDIRTTSDKLNISGVIGRNAYVSAGSIEFSTNSDSQSQVTYKGNIAGDLNYSSKSEISIPDGSVTGKVNYTAPKASNGVSIQTYILSLGKYIVTALILWLLYSWLAPKFLKETDTLVTKKLLPVIGYGIFTPIFAVVAILLLIILGLTSTIATIFGLVLAVLFMISSGTFVIAINNLVCKKLKIEQNTAIFGMLILTAAVLWLILLIPVLGTILSFVEVFVGLGIIVKGFLPVKDSKGKTEKKKSETTKKSDKKETK